jgi:hypothetical protein
MVAVVTDLPESCVEQEACEAVLHALAPDGLAYLPPEAKVPVGLAAGVRIRHGQVDLDQIPPAIM